MPKCHRQLWEKNLPKVLTWRLEWGSTLRPSGSKAPNPTTELPLPTSTRSSPSSVLHHHSCALRDCWSAAAFHQLEDPAGQHPLHRRRWSQRRWRGESSQSGSAPNMPPTYAEHPTRETRVWNTAAATWWQHIKLMSTSQTDRFLRFLEAMEKAKDCMPWLSVAECSRGIHFLPLCHTSQP